MTQNLSPDQAAKWFAQALQERGVDAGIDYFNECLAGDVPRGDEWQKLRDLCTGLSPEQQTLFRFGIQQAIRGAVIGLAVYFDGAAGYSWAGEKPFEFAVALRMYPDVDAAGEIPEAIVHICPTKRGEDIHDILLALFDDGDA